MSFRGKILRNAIFSIIIPFQIYSYELNLHVKNGDVISIPLNSAAKFLGENIEVGGATYHLSTIQKITFSAVGTHLGEKDLQSSITWKGFSAGRLHFNLVEPQEQVTLQLLDLKGHSLGMWNGGLDHGNFSIPINRLVTTEFIPITGAFLLQITWGDNLEKFHLITLTEKEI